MENRTYLYRYINPALHFSRRSSSTRITLFPTMAHNFGETKTRICKAGLRTQNWELRARERERGHTLSRFLAPCVEAHLSACIPDHGARKDLDVVLRFVSRKNSFGLRANWPR